MVAVGVLLLVVGAISLVSGMNAFGDIGISMLYTAAASILAGIGFLVANGKIKKNHQ